MKYGNYWHEPVIHDLNHQVSKAISALNTIRFETIAFSGLSGALLAPIVANAMKKSIVAVRKENERTASSAPAVGVIDGDFVIIDDLIDSARTFNRICLTLSRFKCLAIYTYYDKRSKAERVGVPHLFYDEEGKFVYSNPPEVPDEVVNDSDFCNCDFCVNERLCRNSSALAGSVGNG